MTRAIKMSNCPALRLTWSQLWLCSSTPPQPRQQHSGEKSETALIGREDWWETWAISVCDSVKRGCRSGVEVFWNTQEEEEEGEEGEGGGGLSAGTGSNWNDALFPLTAAGAAVIKCLIVASWEFVLNISSGVMIIWWWVGGGCNHLGWLFDEILDLVVVFHSGFKGSSLPLTYTVLVMSFLKTLLFIFT